MYIDIRMNKIRMSIEFEGPILPGSVSTAKSECGKPNCACKDKKKPKLHGTYYRWTGCIDSQRTTRTITKEQFKESERRIENYRGFLEKLDRLLAMALRQAPWLGEKGENK
jgi:hypothetical protein